MATSPTSDAREALLAITAERTRIDAEIDDLAQRVAEARAEVEERQRGLAALARLDLPGASVVLQVSMTVPLFQWGDTILDGGFGTAICVTPVVLALGMALRRLGTERRLLARVAQPPERR